MGESKAHVVLVPSLGQGHLIPFMELAKLLASQQLSVSYITTPGSAERLQPQIQGSNLDIRLVSLPLPPIDGVPPGISSMDGVPSHVVAILFASSHKLAGPFEQWLDEQMNHFNDNNAQEAPDSFSPPVCIISDIFTGWVHSSGAKFGIPTVVFHTTGAFTTSVTHCLYTHKPHESVEGDEEYFEVPGLSFDLKLRKSDLPVLMRDPDSYPLAGFVRAEIKRSIELGRGILVNTFYELDSLGIDYLRNLTGRPVWSIGPILPAAVFDDTGICRGSMNSRGKAADITKEECLKWLDSRSHQSVVFICFGSRDSLNEKQIRVVAAGLEASGQAFIWAIRCSHAQTKPKGTDMGLPEGFEEKTRERGLMIWGWAPQLLILSHPSVGAFLSHCGWNSTVESVSLGIPMITWPMSAEQPLNSKFLVDRLEIGIQICSDMNSVPDEEEVRRAVTMVLAEEVGKKMRKRAQELRKLAKIALGKAGSSFTNLKYFVQEMQQLEVARARRE